MKVYFFFNVAYAIKFLAPADDLHLPDLSGDWSTDDIQNEINYLKKSLEFLQANSLKVRNDDDEYEKESEFNMYDQDGNVVGTGKATECIFVPKGQPLP